MGPRLYASLPGASGNFFIFQQFLVFNFSIQFLIFSINGGQLSMEGEALNDCHAEVLARRGLVSYLYDQLNIFNSNPSDSIFESPSGSQNLKLKSDVLFHLYVSSAPCGDARIFTLNESLASPLEDLHPNRQGRGALRTKIESGEGLSNLNIIFYFMQK
jgi:double stranded RNA-specific editase B